MKKGGYKIIDFKNTVLNGTAVEMPGIYEQIADDYGKSIMVSGVILNEKLQDDAYASVSETEDSIMLTVYGGVITVTEDNEVSFASSETNNGDILIAESGTNMTWGNKLATIQNAYEGLSDYQKRHAYLLITDIVCPSSGSELFARISFSESKPAISWFDIVNRKYIRVTFNSDGTNMYEDYSSSVSSTIIYLYAPNER